MTAKPLHRLHIESIESIGIVQEGDDPEAKILLFKAATLTLAGAKQLLKTLRIRRQKLNPAATRKEIEAEILRERPDIAAALAKSAPEAGGKDTFPSGSPLSPVARGKAVVKSVMATLDRQDAEIRKIRDDYRKIGDTMTPRKATIAPADTIRGKVDAIALEMVEKGEAPNLTAARPLVWKSRPDLVEASRAEPGRVPGIYGGRAPAADTVPERIGKAVHARADEMSAIPEMWNETDAQRRVRVWKSPQGKKLRAAYTDAKKRGETKFTKSNDHPDAMKILKSWEADPAEGLR